MSEIQNDKDVLRELDSTGFEDIDAPLRDQIPKKLLAQLNEKDLGVKVSEIWHHGNADRQDWLERQQAYLANWDEFLVGDSEGPFEYSSNLHLPMPFIVAKTYHARMLQALMSNDPVAKPRRADAVEKGKVVSDILRYSLNDWCNEHRGIEESIDTFIWDWVTTGVGILKWRWDKLYTRFQDVEERRVPGPPEFETLPDGTQVSRPTMTTEEREVTRTKIIYEGPSADRIPPEDLLSIGGEGDPDKADVVMHRQYLTKSELFNLAYQKIFDQDVVEDIIDSGPDHILGDSSSNIKEQRRRYAGQTDLDTESDLDRYEILEAYMKVDVDSSGIDSDIVVWVHPQTKKILRATYLHRINKAGKRPFVKIDFHKRPGQDYGFGLIEVLYPLSKELDLMHNTRNDFGMLSTMPFGFYRATSNLDPETISFEPGMLIPVDNPQTDVYFPNLGNRTAYGMQEEASLYNLVERLTGVSEMTLGAVTSTQGPTRTATGVKQVAGEANANLDVHVRRMLRGWKKALEYLLHMLQQRIPVGLSFRLTGDDGSDYWTQIRTRDDIAGDYDFEIDPSSASSNPMVRQQRAMEVLQLTSNPLNLQLGIVSPLNHYEAVKSYAQSLGIKNISRFFTRPEGFSLKLTPEEMANRILRGDDPPVLPTDDNQGLIEFYEMIMKDDEMLGQFNQEQIIALTRQVRQRQAFLQAQQAAAAQSANVNQQVINGNTNPVVGAAPLER